MRKRYDFMKKVLIVASVPSMIGQFNMRNIQILQKMGYQVDVACNFEDRSIWDEVRTKKLKKELEQAGIKKYQVDFSRTVWRILEHVKACIQLKTILKEGKYQFLHCHTPIAGAVGRITGHMVKIPVVYTAHGFHFYKGAPLRNWLLYYPAERFLARWTDILITINREDYERALHFHSTRVEYVPGVGIDTEKIKAVNVDKGKKRQELGIPLEAAIFLSVGELNKNKNHVAVIQALSKLKDSRIHYLICGQGSLKEYLIHESRRLGVERQVHLLGFRKDVYEIYQIADVFVHPSYREGLPVAVMEALASGLPCIVSNVRGNRDLMKTQKESYCVRPESVKGFAEAIQSCMEIEIWKQHGKLCRTNFNSYDVNMVGAHLKDIYELL